ncbi:universal stress protein [Ramlibacter terrae]|uniref:Universal stress protein n=1 Tax=Ramlibacter terrae TaxID=2732511 RepID=A0ABX6P1W5_9BURK|nr:universal stress protein [Ramlibacter terrae]
MRASHQPFRTILVLTDLSDRENIAVQRASQIAATHRAALRIVYMPARPNDPVVAPAALAAAALQLEAALELPVTVAAVAAGRLDEVVAHATGADLVVLPHRRERSVAAFFRGQPVARLLRLCRSPVLVARASRSPHYARILVGVDLSPASADLLALAARLDPRSELEVFHAVSTLNEARLRSAEATETAVRLYRENALADARERMVALTDSFVARRNRFLATVGRGDPGTQAIVQQQHSGADLVVVGKRAASAWGDFLCGSVAHRVLGWGSSDVLVVPHGGAPQAVPVPRSPGGWGALAMGPAGGSCREPPSTAAAGRRHRRGGERLRAPGTFWMHCRGRAASNWRGRATAAVFALRELGLADARLALRQAYGERVRFGAVTVHSEVDPATGALLAPLMFLRIDTPRAHRPALLQLLRERGVAAHDIDAQRDRVVLRAEVPLARLLGWSGRWASSPTARPTRCAGCCATRPPRPCRTTRRHGPDKVGGPAVRRLLHVPGSRSLRPPRRHPRLARAVLRRRGAVRPGACTCRASRRTTRWARARWPSRCWRPASARWRPCCRRGGCWHGTARGASCRRWRWSVSAPSAACCCRPTTACCWR